MAGRRQAPSAAVAPWWGRLTGRVAVRAAPAGPLARRSRAVAFSGVLLADGTLPPVDAELLDDGSGPWAPRWGVLAPTPVASASQGRARARGGGPEHVPDRDAANEPQRRRRPGPVPIDSDELPWRAVGRIDVPGGWASGVLVGPRHVLTASHVVAWEHADPPGGARPRHVNAGWLRFTPAARPGRAPFGAAGGSQVLAPLAVVPPCIEEHEERYDYAVVVLDRRIGEDVGWLGVREYEERWDRESFWTLAGYQGHDAASAEPVAVPRLALLGHEAHSEDSQVIYHDALAGAGLSGGPLLARWPGDGTPSVVGVQSWSNAFLAGACGGRRLGELVTQALREHP